MNAANIADLKRCLQHHDDLRAQALANGDEEAYRYQSYVVAQRREDLERAGVPQQ